MPQTIIHNGVRAIITGEDVLTVTVDGKKIGVFVFSEGHSGAPFSNSYGIDCYQHTWIGDECVWQESALYSSRRSAAKALIESAQKAGII